MLEEILESLIKEDVYIDNNTALIVVDMINDGCRKGGVLETIGFDISPFKKIEKNVSELANSFSKKGREVIYVRSLYDFEYLPELMIDKFVAFGLDKLNFSKKGNWGSQLIDSLPDVATAFIFKSNYSAFSEGFTALFDISSFEKNKEYFHLNSNLDVEYQKQGKLTLKDYYKQSLENELKVLFNNEVHYPLSLHGYLKSKGIDTVVCVGGSTHVCLGATVYSAAERGYKIFLPIDAIASEDKEKHIIYLQNFSKFSAKLIKTISLLKQ